MTKQTDSKWIDEFSEKFGKAYVSDKEGGHFIGSYLIEFIDNLIATTTKQAVEANDKRWIKKIDKLINSLKKLPDDETMTKKPVILELQVLKDTLLTTK